MVIGLIGAGAMGSALGARLRDGGVRVLVALDGRSDRTRRLAHAAGLEDAQTPAGMLADASVVLSVVPPGAAVEVAAAVATAAGDSRPLVVDLNAVAPATVQRLAALLAEHGIDTVDGSISGPPPIGPGRRASTSPGPARPRLPDCRSTASSGSSSATTSGSPPL